MKCVMKPLYSVLISLYLVSCVTCTESPAIVEQQFADYISCDRDSEDLTELAHLGWPFMFECKKLVTTFSFMVEEGEYDDESGECIIRDLVTGTTLWNKTMYVDSWYYTNYKEDEYRYYTSDINEQSPASYIILFKHAAAKFCTYQIVHLNITELSKQPECKNVNEEITDLIDHNRVGDKVHFSCEVPNKVKPALYLDRCNPDDIIYEWTYNCTNMFESNVFFVNNSMIIHNSNFRNAGVYTCSVIYKGQKRYAIQYHYCLKYPSSSFTQFHVNCPDEVEVLLGEDVSIDCHVDLGTGKTNEFDLYAEWKKFLLNETIVNECKNPTTSLKNSTTDSRVQCSLASSLEDKCYMYVTEEEIPRDILNASLKIRNVKYFDFGVYSLSCGVTGNLQQRNITLWKSHERILRRNTIAIAAGTCALIVLCFFASILIWRKYDVLWYFKKYFGPYETEFRNYTAYLAYYYSNDENEISSESKRLTKKLVLQLSDLLAKFGGNTYNEHKDGESFQYKAENIYEMQKDCHRVIIVLTPEYIKDHWSIYKAYMALHNMVENGTKMIFIVTPGAKKELKSVSEKPKTTMLKAMKMNTTIHWSGKTPLDGTFRRRLEYSLPKLPAPGYNRYFSNTSQAPLTQVNGKFSDISPTRENVFTCSV